MPNQWYEHKTTGIKYEYLGESRAQFAGGIRVAILRDLAGEETRPYIGDFYEQYREIPTPEGAPNE